MNWKHLCVVGILAATACNDDVDTETDTDLPAAGPDLAWTDQPTEALLEAEPLTISVSASDADGVARVVTYYRASGTRTWITAPEMELDGELWVTTLPAEAIVAPGIEVYFKGEDEPGTSSFLPEAGGQGPLSVAVRRVGIPVPYSQDFEDVPNDLLREIGWSETSLKFEGYEWSRTVDRAYSGEGSMSHGRTPPELAAEIDDWLITPVLDLTTLTAAQVDWWEYGDRTEAAVHKVWISTSSPDPRDGSYTLLKELNPPPERQWGRSDAIDLSDYASEPAVYLAWSYEGIDADRWLIDDVQVRALGPDVRVASFSSSIDPLAPGDSGTLTLTVENRTPVEATNVSVVVEAAFGAEFSEVPVIASLAGSGSVDVEVPFSVDTDAYPNGWLDLTFTTRTETDEWLSYDRLLVGQPTTGSLTYTLDPASELDPEQLIRVVLGVGDIDEPTLEIPLAGEFRTAGTYTTEFDLTDYAEYLPPEPGELRWWARIEQGPSGSIDSFIINYGGEDLVSADTGPFFSFGPGLAYLPQPPEPIVTRQTTTPNPVAPGSTVAWSVDMVNIGESTAGPTTVSITTTDPQVTVTGGGPASIGTSGGWARGASGTVAFDFTVASDRKSSLPIQFMAEVTDAYETVSVPVDVRVPWPVLTVTGLVIDDVVGGDGDGLLESGESARLDISITNVGGLNTFGSTTCTLSSAGGTAGATIDQASAFIGIVSAGSTEDDDDYEVTVTSGADGDTLDFTMTCVDRTETYVSNFQVVLGERPWIAISAVDDAIGDNLKSYRFDVVSGRYRSDGTTLELELTSATDFGGLTGLFIEFWGRNVGGDYTFYNAASAGASGNVRGYVGRSFTPLTGYTVTEVDGRTVRFSIPLAPLGLGSRGMELGFGVGFCGGTTQYCDHFPDGWGAPFTGLNTSRWVSLDW